MPRRGKSKVQTSKIDGLILPREANRLRSLWEAFRTGSTWEPFGKRTKVRRVYRHTAYSGKLTLEWWGKAIHFVIEDPGTGGMLAGAFAGHVRRHGRESVGQIEMRFS